MLYSALLAPTERPPSVRQLKRALLTYDSVILLSPNDRDLFPRNLIHAAMFGMPLPFGMAQGPVRPLLKTEDFDNDFDRLMNEMIPAVRAGHLKVISTYDKSQTDAGMTIGSTPTGGYNHNPAQVLRIYRDLGGDQELMRAAISPDVHSDLLSVLPQDDLNSLDLCDFKINNVPGLPDIDADLSVESKRRPLTNVARARIASVVKTVAHCHAHSLVPIFTSPGFTNVAEAITNRATRTLDAPSDDPLWTRRSRIVNLANAEYLDDTAIDELTIDDVIRLRSRVWGTQAELRDEMFDSALHLALDAEDDSTFDDAFSAKLIEYRTAAKALENERRNLRLRIECDLGLTVAGIGATAQLKGVCSWEGALIAAAIWGYKSLPDYVKMRDSIRANETRLAKSGCYGLHNYFRALG